MINRQTGERNRRLSWKSRTERRSGEAAHHCCPQCYSARQYVASKRNALVETGKESLNELLIYKNVAAYSGLLTWLGKRQGEWKAGGGVTTVKGNKSELLSIDPHPFPWRL